MGSAARIAAVGAAIALASAPGTARAYRTFADDPRVSAPARWEDGLASVRWEIDGRAFDAPLDPARVAAATAMAAVVWDRAGCAAPGGAVAIVEDAIAAPGDGRNTITLVSRDWVERGLPAAQAAYTDVRIERSERVGARIIEADIYLNGAEFELSLDGGGIDLQAVLTHELGHAHGLLHPCEIDGALGAPACAEHPEMIESALHPVYAEGGGRRLSGDDAAGLCALYASSCAASCAPGFECRDAACVPACDDSECSGGECAPAVPCAAGVCGLIGDSLGRCVTQGDTGTPCSRADDCASSLCLESSRHSSYCTIPCSDDSECSGLQSCRSVEGRSVCSPLPSSGCSVGARSGRAGVASLWATLLALWMRHRSRRTP